MTADHQFYRNTICSCWYPAGFDPTPDYPVDPKRKSYKQCFSINCDYLNQLALFFYTEYNAIRYFMRLFLYDLRQFPCDLWVDYIWTLIFFYFLFFSMKQALSQRIKTNLAKPTPYSETIPQSFSKIVLI